MTRLQPLRCSVSGLPDCCVAFCSRLTLAAALFSVRVRRLINAPGSAVLSVLDGRSSVYFTCGRRTLALVLVGGAAACARLLGREELLQASQVVLRRLHVEDGVRPAAREGYD